MSCELGIVIGFVFGWGFAWVVDEVLKARREGRA
jgi:hypothetical protein